VIPSGYHKGKKDLPGYCVGQGPQTTFPVWVLPSAATSGGPLGVLSLHKMAPVARSISWGQWDERAWTWTSLSANIVETKTAVPLQSVVYIVHYFRSWHRNHPSAFHVSTCNTYRASKSQSWAILTELQNHNLGSYLQSFKIVTYRASKPQSWAILTELQDCDLQSFKITIWVIMTELQDCDLQSFKITILGHTSNREYCCKLQYCMQWSFLVNFVT